MTIFEWVLTVYLVMAASGFLAAFAMWMYFREMPDPEIYKHRSTKEKNGSTANACASVPTGHQRSDGKPRPLSECPRVDVLHDGFCLQRPTHGTSEIFD